MKQVTRNIDPASARDLLERVPRACICFAGDHGPQAQPVIMLWFEGRYLVGFPEDAACQPSPGQEAVLLIDEGIYYFDLRAIYIRGQVRPAEVPPNVPSSQIWFEVVAAKTVAWDYGMMRAVKNES